jgi:hypothetical protein
MTLDYYRVHIIQHLAVTAIVVLLAVHASSNWRLQHAIAKACRCVQWTTQASMLQNHLQCLPSATLLRLHTSCKSHSRMSSPYIQ